MEAAIARILVADDHDVVRKGLRHILESEDQWEVVGEATNGEDAIRLNGQLEPDAIVMDITMPVMNGLDATREIVRAKPNSTILILTMHDGQSVSQAVRDSGAMGLIIKSQATEEVMPALKAILAGNTYFAQ